jgi:hypothetical protein
MSDKTKSTSHDEAKPKEVFGLTGTTTGSSGEHLATTGASALGTSGGSGDMGNEKSNIDRATGGLAPAGSTTVQPSIADSDQGTR